MRRLIWLPRLAAGNRAKMICRCPDQIHPVAFGDSVVYQFSRSHLLVREKGRIVYKNPFAFRGENWYVVFACFGCEMSYAQHFLCCRAAEKVPAKSLLRPSTFRCRSLTAGMSCWPCSEELSTMRKYTVATVGTVGNRCGRSKNTPLIPTVINGRNGING